MDWGNTWPELTPRCNSASLNTPTEDLMVCARSISIWGHGWEGTSDHDLQATFIVLGARWLEPLMQISTWTYLFWLRICISFVINTCLQIWIFCYSKDDVLPNTGLQFICSSKQAPPNTVEKTQSDISLVCENKRSRDKSIYQTDPMILAVFKLISNVSDLICLLIRRRALFN